MRGYTHASIVSHIIHVKYILSTKLRCTENRQIACLILSYIIHFKLHLCVGFCGKFKYNILFETLIDYCTTIVCGK